MDTTFFDDNIKKSIYDQFLTIWVQPEIENRKELGLLPDSFNLYSNDLYAAQVIFFPDNRNRIIRLNDEVIVRAKVKLKEPLNYSVGDKININQFESYENFVLAEEDFADCGHITMKKLKNVCLIAFSGIYNKDISQKHLDKAEEFYESAKYASHNEFSSVFIDNLFSACELAIKAILLTNPTTKLREKASHKVIQIRMNENVELGNIEEKYKKIFDDLSTLRRTERYLENGLKKIVVNKEEMLNTTKTLIDFAKSHIRIC